MSLLSYTFKRLATSFIVLVVASVVIFSIVRLIPGDPAIVILGPDANREALENLRRNLGLHRPFWEQYFVWVYDVLTLQWGESLVSGVAVVDLLMFRFPRSIMLATFALAIAIAISFPLAIAAATNRNTIIDNIAVFFSQIGISVPNFWLGILFILIFASHLGVLPPSGYRPITTDPVGWLQHSIMPAMSLAVVTAAMVTRHLRSELLENMNEDYVRTARAHGINIRKIIGRYVLKNALIPTLTVLGIMFGSLLGGVVIIEVVFSYPGVGLLILDGIIERDYPVVQVALLLVISAFIIINFVVDVLYGVLDPRIREGY